MGAEGGMIAYDVKVHFMLTVSPVVFLGQKAANHCQIVRDNQRKVL